MEHASPDQIERGTASFAVPALQLRNISKEFPGVKALDGINFDVQPGEVHALLGENGAGKSTLIKILSGVYQPDSGEIIIGGNKRHFSGYSDALDTGIATIFQEFTLIPYLNAVENIFLGREITRGGFLRIAEMRRIAAALFERLEFPINIHTPVAELSIAHQQFIEIAKALSVNARILVLDEPTATLTPGETQHLFSVMRELKKQGVSMIFISHHLEEIFEITDRITILRDGRQVGQALTSEITTDRLVEIMIGRKLESSFPPKPEKTALDKTHSSPPLLDVRAIQINGSDPVNSLQVRSGEILGFAGMVGSGRTELAMSLIGETHAHRKDILRNGVPIRIKSPTDALRQGLGLLPENRKVAGLILDFSIRDNLSINNFDKMLRAGMFISSEIEDKDCKSAMISTGVRASSAATAVGNLSGGNQQKVVFARWLLRGCQVLILDEPTRGIDVGSKAEIYRLIRDLADQGHGIIFISSELQEVVGLCDRAAVFYKGAIAATLEGDALTNHQIMQYATGSLVNEAA
jgi:ribose transport system ATP-binding protein